VASRLERCGPLVAALQHGLCPRGLRVAEAMGAARAKIGGERRASHARGGRVALLARRVGRGTI